MRDGILSKGHFFDMIEQWLRGIAGTSRFLAMGCLVLAVTGCGGGKKQTRTRVPAPPTISSESRTARSVPPVRSQRDRAEEQDTSAANPELEAFGRAKPIYVETGVASWYGPPYHNRKAANGQVFDMHALTAAHKTLPLGSVIRVTNISNGKAALMRVTDRGPFIGDRVLDLSMGAAKEIGVYRTGLANVKIEVLDTPKPLNTGGRWCVQIGAFSDSDEAAKLKSKLIRKYKTAKVIQFAGPTGDWVRIRPMDDDRSRAFEVARDTKVNEGGVFLVRLD
ncbi:MAG TPA: septal ring lytic transglycosylase RlpA family protein [Terriglobales bacterium]|nr:septal ring lytic transglycosylase RlpA family protein [Terriglobales bacterium]